MSRGCRFALLLSGLLCLFASTSWAAGESDWEFIDNDDGIHVWKREIPGEEMPGFRGQTMIKASIADILKHMMDWKRHTEWMYACKESAMLKEFSPDHALMYNRVGAPWPVWDRDVIADTQIERTSDGRHVKITFQNVSSTLRAIPKRVIRLPKLVGFYKLWELSPKQTKVLYQVEADLGGSIPRWLAKRGARDLPHVTLEKLRDRVEGRD